jgi:hypothetical protein
MNWRISLFLLLLAALGTGYWWLDGVMATQAWAVATDEKWRIAGTGWETLKHAWPVAVAGTLIGGGIVFVFMGYLYMTATDADHENEIARINTHKALSDENAAQAQIRADKSIKADREALRAQERQLEEREERLKRLETEAVKRVQLAEERANEAQKQVEQANLTANDAERRRQNATAAAARRKRQAERLKQEATNETNADQN